MHRTTLMGVVLLSVCLATGVAYGGVYGGGNGVTFSIDQGPAGSVPFYNDGTLLTYCWQLGPTPDCACQALVEMPIDALHIGKPISGLIDSSLTFTGSLLFSLDHGDPFPVGIAPDSEEEVRIAWQYPPPAGPGDWVTKTAVGFNMGLNPSDTRSATEPNMGLGAGSAFDDDIDGLHAPNGLDCGNPDPIFFSIDDRFSLIPNAPADFRTVDIFVRLPDGYITRVIDGVVDLGLAHDGDGPGSFFYENDDIDAMILVNLDDNPENNRYKEISYNDPATGDPKTVLVDLGDGILFSIDHESNLPYADGGTSASHFRPSIPTKHVWFSSYGGLATLDSVISHDDLGLNVGPDAFDDIDALAYGVYTCQVPEPGTMFLVGTAGLMLIGVVTRRRMKR